MQQSYALFRIGSKDQHLTFYVCNLDRFEVHHCDDLPAYQSVWCIEVGYLSGGRLDTDLFTEIYREFVCRLTRFDIRLGIDYRADPHLHLEEIIVLDHLSEYGWRGI